MLPGGAFTILEPVGDAMPPTALGAALGVWRSHARAIVRSAGFLLTLWLGLAAIPAAAQGVFTVEGIRVDATAADANAAREVAFAGGTREAYRKLLEQIVPREYYARLPDPRPADLTAMVFSLQVENERTSPTRYLANLTVNFRRDAVRSLLQRSNVPFAETASRPVLIVPVYTSAGATLLWDDPNPWRQAWSFARNRNSLAPMVLANGDLTDVGLISAAQAANADRARLAAVAARYGVEDVLVAQANLRFEIGSRVPSIDVVLRRFGPAGEGTTIEGYRGDAAEPVQTLLNRAVESIVTGIEDRWKRENLLAFGNEAVLSANVPLASLSDWIGIRQRLERAPEIKAVDLAEVSTTSAQVLLRYFGEAGRLVVALAQRGLVLSQAGGYWTLSLRPGAPASN
jgi:hypothetical protein